MPRLLLSLLLLAFSVCSYADELDTALGTANRYLQELELSNPTEQQRQQRMQWLDVQQKLQSAKGYQEQLSRLAEQVRQAPDEIKRIRSRLKTALPVNQLSAQQRRDLSSLEQRLIRETASSNGLGLTLSELDNRIETLQGNPGSLQQSLAQSRLQLEDIPEIDALPTNTDELERLQMLAIRMELQARVRLFEQQLASYETRLELNRARRDETNRSYKHQRSLVTIIQQQVAESRRRQAETAKNQTEKASQAASGKHPVIAEAAEINAGYSNQLEQLVAELETSANRKKSLEQSRQLLEETNKILRQQLQLSELGEVVGEVLRSYQDRVPDVYQLRRELLQLERNLIAARLEQSRSKVIYRNLSDLDSSARLLLIGIEKEQQADLFKSLKPLLDDRRELLQQINKRRDAYLTNVLSEDLLLRELLGQSERFSDALGRQLLWTANAEPVDGYFLAQLTQVLQQLFKDVSVESLKKSVADLPQEKITGYLILLLLPLGLWLARKPMQQALSRHESAIGNVREDRFSYTLEALFFPFLIEMPIPLTMLCGALILKRVEEPAVISQLGSALIEISVLLLFMRWALKLVNLGGLVDLHFRWPEPARLKLLYQLRALLVPAILLVGLLVLAEDGPDQLVRNTLGRIVFIILCVVSSAFIWRLLSPKLGVLSHWAERIGQASRGYLRYLIKPVLLTTPIVLALLSIAGYHFTALQLSRHLLLSLAAVVVITLVYNTILRWLMVAERRLRLNQALARRAAVLAARENDDTDEEPSEVDEQQLVDVARVSDQTRGIMKLIAALALLLLASLIWLPLWPALGVLEQQSLWEIADNTVTTADILGMVLMILVTWALVRNLPGLLEILILQRKGVKQGTRYAVVALSRYAVIAIGFVLTLGALGVGWGQVQWLVAALGVGLGFGLQEIFANFISGLILLFERPIRVGDTVTVGDMTGTVSKIRIRATTVVDYDRREIVIPNKLFVTERLINWTLSDNIVRLQLRLTLAHGQSVTHITQTMLQVGQSHPLVMKEPEPMVIMLESNEVGRQFELRIFIEDLMHKVQVTNETYDMLFRALEREGLQLATPKRQIEISQQQLNHHPNLGH